MDERTWEGLLARALAILDDLAGRGLGRPEVVLGGGTVLMMRLHHRLSKDVELFLHDARWLSYLTPRLNDRIAAMACDYSEQANSLELVFGEGDVDFIVAGSVTGIAPGEATEFLGRSLMLESTEEILAKKLFFRAALLKPRDVFDLVAASLVFPAAVERAVAASAPRRAEQLNRLRALGALPVDRLSADIAAIGEFAKILPTMIQSAAVLLETGAARKNSA
jgi:hypothetical protein